MCLFVFFFILTFNCVALTFVMSVELMAIIGVFIDVLNNVAVF